MLSTAALDVADVNEVGLPIIGLFFITPNFDVGWSVSSFPITTTGPVDPGRLALTTVFFFLGGCLEVVMPIVLLDGPPTPITLDAAAAALTAALITCGLGGPDAPGRGLGGIVVEIGSEVNVDEESKLLLLLLLVLVVVVLCCCW